MGGSREMRERVDLPIEASASAEGPTYLDSNNVLAGLELPATFEAATAYLKIEGAFAVGGIVTGDVFQPRDYAGNVIGESWVTVAAVNTNRNVKFTADAWDHMNILKITAYLADKVTPIAQTSKRTITAIVRNY